MSLTRRTFLFAICLLPYIPKVGLALPTDWVDLAKADVIPPVIPPELDEFKNQPSLNNEDSIVGENKFGNHPATPAEERIGKKLLDKAPTNCRPIDVALYFLSIGQGKYGDENKPYITAWPVRWNPVIKGFFDATKTNPNGDTTAWCAAFVNYCLMKAATDKTLPSNSSERTKSAGSKSFRKWGKETNSPKPGDLVVFINKKDTTYGHVGFFLAEKDDDILVLGGNQFEGTPVRHTINRKLISKDGTVLEFHSYRTEEQLHV